MRVLFDTNVLYSALTAKGVCEDVLDEAAGECAIIWSLPLQVELETTLRRNYRLGPGTQAALTSFSELCEFFVPVTLAQPVCRDADDDIVLATAAAGHADMIVTGDDDLLVLKKFQGIRILSPRQFLALLSA